MTKKEFIIYTLVVALFVAIVIILAYIQFYFVLKIEIRPIFFVIPTFIGTIFGTIFVLSRHFYRRMKEKEFFEMIAKYDTLTGVMSRYAGELILDFQLRQNRRLQMPFSILMVDIDDFKKINDSFGHGVGDVVLVATAEKVSHQLRDSDTLCRWGGEEFIVVLPETTVEQIHEVAEKIRVGVENHDFNIPQKVTVSIGGVTVDYAQEQMHHYIKKADDALYSAKRNGKNRYVIAE